MTGSLRRIRHCSPRRTSSTWVPPARQRRGSSSPGCRELSSFEDRAPRALERTSQDQATRFPVELPRGASQPRPALHEWHQMLAQASSGDRSISVPTPAALAICSGEPHVSPETTRHRGTYGLRFHKGAHICGQPTLRWGSAVHRVVHNGGQATFCTLACTDGTGSSPGTRATRGWGGGCGGKMKTGASTPRAPTGADTHSVYGRSVCTVTPLTLERGPFH